MYKIIIVATCAVLLSTERSCGTSPVKLRRGGALKDTEKKLIKPGSNTIKGNLVKLYMSKRCRFALCIIICSSLSLFTVKESGLNFATLVALFPSKAGSQYTL